MLASAACCSLTTYLNTRADIGEDQMCSHIIELVQLLGWTKDSSEFSHKWASGGYNVVFVGDNTEALAF